MNIITTVRRETNRSSRPYYSLDTETQPNNSSISDDVILKFYRKQIQSADCMKSRIESKKLFEKKLREVGRNEEADKLARCCANYTALVCENGHSFRGIPDYRCRQLCCPDCGRAKAERELRRTLPKLLQALKSDPSLFPALMTLTLKAIPDETVEEGWRRAKLYFKKLRRRSIFRDCVGGYAHMENTKTNNGLNPHLHVLILLRHPIAQTALSAEWLHITGDSKVVDIRKIDDLADGIIQTFCYAFKPVDLQKLDSEEIDQLFAMKGKRFGGSFGVIFGIETERNIVARQADEYTAFIAETKRVKLGDPCPICKTKLDAVNFSADGLARFMASVPIPSVSIYGQPKCRGN
jgi:hypothetical protein